LAGLADALFHTGLAALEQRLQREDVAGTFCHGEQPTIADICLAASSP
jgi:maleylacetoacetate isomerase/maleylpyruvate isomerase